MRSRKPSSGFDSLCFATPVRRLLVMLACISALWGCGRSQAAGNAPQPNAPRVAVVRVARQDLTRSLQIASEFLSYQEIDVYAKVSGYIQKLNINWGTHVKRGDVMAVLEVPELEQQLHYDEAALRGRENELMRAKEEQRRVQSGYAVAHVTYTRLADVWKTQPGLISQEDLDVAQGKDSEADASVSAAKATRASAEEAVTAAQATLQKDRELFAYSRITASFDGVITHLNAYTGALLPAGTSSSNSDLSLCHLSQNNLLRLVIPVPERSVPDVHVGDEVPVQVTTINQTFRGKVVRFSDQIDLATRTMHTEVDVPNPKYKLVPGMYAYVQFPLQTARQVLVVPLQAVQATAEDRGSVMVVSSTNTLEKREVTLGLTTSDEVEVVSGLRENESVVFGEQSQYRPGERVIPIVVQPPRMD